MISRKNPSIEVAAEAAAPGETVEPREGDHEEPDPAMPASRAAPPDNGRRSRVIAACKS